MRPLRRLVLLLLPWATAFGADTSVSGRISVGGGGAFLKGDRAAFQHRFQHHEAGAGGLDGFTLTRVAEDTQLRIDARAIPGNEDYFFGARWEKFDAWFIEASYRQFRVFDDASGGRLLPRDLAVSYFDEALAIDRSALTVQLGTQSRHGVQLRLRYDHTTREGAKSSIRWGDSNLAGAPYSPRGFIPSYFLIDERRDIVTAEASAQDDRATWRVRARHERTTLRNRHVARRRALEPQDRHVTITNLATSDLFAGHAFYERVFHEKLRASAGGLITRIDAGMGGTHIAGGGAEAQYSSTFAGRQSGDKGYLDLLGQARLKQYVGNANLVYQPARFWTLRPGVKYEHLRTDAGESHTETSFTGAALTAVQNATEAASRNAWNEVTEDFEVRYTRWADLHLSARSVLQQGIGSLAEQSILVATRAPIIDRDTRYERAGQRHTLDASWHPRPGLTFGVQFNHRRKTADYRARRDSTANEAGSRDRYPSFIVDQDIDSADAALRVSWRPRPSLSFVSRYAAQRAIVTSTFAGLPAIRNGRLTRSVLTESATWTPTPRLHLNAAVNVTFDQLLVPGHQLTIPSDNNYTTATLGAGYALGKITDVFLDGSFFRADNYTDNALVTLPLNAGHLQHSMFLTWVRRQSARLIYTARYGFASYRDGTYGGQNDFQAHLFYGNVQYKF